MDISIAIRYSQLTISFLSSCRTAPRFELHTRSDFMPLSAARKISLSALVLAAGIFGFQTSSAESRARREPCPGDDSGLTLPDGFCATVFADGIGHARHMVSAPNGVLYVNTWSGDYYANDKPPSGGFLVALKDST